MSDVVNLNKFRKQKQRAEQAVQAQNNRAAFGRTKAEKNLAKARQDQSERQLDAHRLKGDERE